MSIGTTDADLMIDKIDQELLKLYYASQNKTEYQFYDFYEAFIVFEELALKEGVKIRNLDIRNISDIDSDEAFKPLNENKNGREKYFELKAYHFIRVFSSLIYSIDKVIEENFISYDPKSRIEKIKITTLFTVNDETTVKIIEQKVNDDDRHEYLIKNEADLKDKIINKIYVNKYNYLLEGCTIKGQPIGWEKKFKTQLESLSWYYYDYSIIISFEEYIKQLLIRIGEPYKTEPPRKLYELYEHKEPDVDYFEKWINNEITLREWLEYGKFDIWETLKEYDLTEEQKEIIKERQYLLFNECVKNVVTNKLDSLNQFDPKQRIINAKEYNRVIELFVGGSTDPLTLALLGPIIRIKESEVIPVLECYQTLILNYSFDDYNIYQTGKFKNSPQFSASIIYNFNNEMLKIISPPKPIALKNPHIPPEDLKKESEVKIKVSEYFSFMLKRDPRNSQLILSQPEYANLVEWVSYFFENEYSIPQIDKSINKINTAQGNIVYTFIILFDHLMGKGVKRPDELFDLIKKCFYEYRNKDILNLKKATTMPLGYNRLVK